MNKKTKRPQIWTKLAAATLAILSSQAFAIPLEREGGVLVLMMSQ